ncbi:MAG: hypothetical protein Q4B68_03720 [Bacteroidales bacterium]|nr:hypothetical protein [Bacteroidales bacterium]
MNRKYSEEKEKKKLKEIKKRNVLSLLLFLLLVVACIILSRILPKNAEHQAPEPIKPSTTITK